LNARRTGSRHTTWFCKVAVVLLLCTTEYFPVATGAAEPDTQSPTATVQGLCDVLLQAMKKGSALDFAGRVRLLDPTLRRLYDLPLLTRLVIGPPWRGLSPEDQQALVTAFSDYSIAVYASRFKSYNNERFVVDPTLNKTPSGDAIVPSKLIPGSGEPVQLNYLLRQEPSGWHIIDVLLNGTISEMAERRSEYASTLRDGGATALVQLLRQKTEQLQK